MRVFIVWKILQYDTTTFRDTLMRREKNCSGPILPDAAKYLLISSAMPETTSMRQSIERDRTTGRRFIEMTVLRHLFVLKYSKK